MEEEAFERAKEFAEKVFEGDSSGHDIHHTLRVHSLARSICAEEGGDEDVVRMAALLHDVDDPKLFHSTGYPNACRFMEGEGMDSETIERVVRIITQISFKGTGTVVPDSLEGKIVQDADRMDAIGAIGIARAFAYGGSRGRPMHDPGEKPKENMTEAEYRANQGKTVNHFYEKLLKLKDLMNTDAAKRMAEARHRYMQGFLDEFMDEWDGKRRFLHSRFLVVRLKVEILRIS